MMSASNSQVINNVASMIHTIDVNIFHQYENLTLDYASITLIKET